MTSPHPIAPRTEPSPFALAIEVLRKQADAWMQDEGRVPDVNALHRAANVLLELAYIADDLRHTASRFAALTPTETPHV